ncbi:DUF6660 family protein [Pedobacter nanyangensis]|uniref:DUF6660 family protein n=1 Tax=Pedobacter nanyangensis TaxID=1562389 RepID=UPI000DE44360|nr:DUF6660 family protein [Pedobacter nanyangensis]
MKWLLFIWAFYLLGLASLPCSDVGNQCKDDGPKMETVKAHNHEKDKDDKCAPFCYCSCCSVSLASFDFKLIEIAQPKAIFAEKNLALHHHQLVSNYYGNIWNPPKLTA